MTTKYKKLEARFRQYYHLKSLSSIAQWDEAVVMPTGAGEMRGQSLAELASIMQKLISAREVGDWIGESEVTATQLDPWQRANLREIKRLFIENTVVPVELNQKLVVAKMKSEQLWRRLHKENNWTDFAPCLEEVLSLTREMLTVLGSELKLSLYDTALSLYSPGLTTSVVEKLFNELKATLPKILDGALAKQAREKTLLPEGHFPMEAQKALGLELMTKVGFDLNHGRLDESHHPFCGGAPGDVRITTRYSENEFLSSLMGVLHETGHSLYEQNLTPEWVQQPVGGSCGMAIHESQSLLMEMQVVRSREFLQFAGPMIRKHMGPFVKNPESLDDENLGRLVTRVDKGFIRVNADELTYPFHVIMRFEIERELLEGCWPLADLPRVWSEKMRSYLGLSTDGNFKDGCMQDVHWPGGAWGYFPAYTFGAVIAAQLFAAADRQHPGLRSAISRGDFEDLQSWLKCNVWSRGMRLQTLELVEEASGRLSTESFRKHLEARYL